MPRYLRPFKACASAAAAGLLVLTVGAVTTSAQTTVPPGPSAPSSPEHRRLPGPATPRPGTSGETLGQAPGVIQPPATGDNGVIVPRNQTDAPTPVIHPPGTPGGDPHVQPQ